MMAARTHWINTDEFYREIIAAPDSVTRERLYRERFIRPWKPMMDMLAPMFHADPSDDLAVARAWAWLLPDDLTETPDALRKLEAADAWTVAARALAEGAAQFDGYADRLPIESVEGWLVIANPARADPIGRGYTGGIDFTQPRLIAQFDTPNDTNLPRLPGLVAHELHHVIHLRVFPWNMATTSVADYIVHEGMAESFAAALYGADSVGYYVTEFDESELATAKALIGAGLDKTGFDVIRAHIFGDHFAEQFGLPKIGMPAFGGYAIGYRVVQAYLNRTGQSVADATFVPAGEIVRESGFFS